MTIGFESYTSVGLMNELQSFPLSQTHSLLQGFRILLAEDSKDNCLLVQKLLMKAGAFVETAENGKIAIEKALSTSYDLILMDIQMPVCDGYSATRSLRESGFQKPIIAFTAHAMPGEREKCLSAGCNDFLTKPVSRENLLGTVSTWRTELIV